MKENLTIEYNSDIYISTTFNCYLLDGPFLYLTGQDVTKKGVLTMKEKKIMLPTMAEAKRFVDEATKCDFDIDVFYNRVTIDAKSILGVLSLDLTRVLTVQFNGENEEFEEYLDSISPEANASAA